MADNPWLPIDTMPLSAVGTKVDLIEDGRIYSGATVDRASTSRWSLMDEIWPDAPERLKDSDRFCAHIDTIEHGVFTLDRDAEWRPHV